MSFISPPQPQQLSISKRISGTLHYVIIDKVGGTVRTGLLFSWSSMARVSSMAHGVVNVVRLGQIAVNYNIRVIIIGVYNSLGYKLQEHSLE